MTVKLTDWAVVPPAPVHDKVRVSEALTATAKVPLVIWVPVQPVPPLAVQDTAF